MNKSVIRYVLGSIMKTEAVLMLLPCIVSVVYRETEGVYYIITLTICGVLGILMTIKRPANFVFYLKEGCIATSLGWIVLSISGCIPFILTGEIPSFTDAMFETVSGFSTTGASILENVEILSHTSLFWRSFTHWIGGMGVLVFMMAIIPLSGGSNINLMRAESPGPSVGKLVPKMKYTARLLYVIYFGLTVIELMFLLIGDMPLFDALTTSFGTAGTGGFGIKNDSIMSYSPYIQWIVTIFMILFGVNFNAYYFIVYRKFKKAFGMEEVRWYFVIILSAVGIVFLNILNTTANVLDALRHASFQVASIMTTTGFSTVDFNMWSQNAKMVLILLMFVGACAGSTGGGIKVSRFMVMIKSVCRELNSYIHPKSIRKVKIEGKSVDNELINSIGVYLVTFVVVFASSVLVISVEGRDFTSNFTAVAATINNIGPGLELVGPTQNFSSFGVLSKWVFIFDMLAGRLELFPLLILFHPAMWKQYFTRNSKSAYINRRREQR